jgi:hypothetical protein
MSLITTAAYGGQVWGQHYWTDQLRSSVVWGINQYNVPSSLAFTTAQSQQQQSAYVNLIWSPVKSVNIGLEFMWGERQQRRNPATGNQSTPSGERLQAALQYVF